MCIINEYLYKIKRVLNFNDINNKLHKVYLDYDMVFYGINLDEIRANFVYDEDEFYDSNIEGVPAYLKLQKPNRNNYEYFPEFHYYKLDRGQEYAVITYKYKGWYSTRAVATVQSLSMSGIKILKHK